MPRESNFFEEAMALCQDSDPNVANIARGAYSVMLEQHQRRNSAPEGAFNILYFTQALIRAWLSERPYVALREDTAFPQHCDPIKGANWPAVVTSSNQIANRFLDFVKAESTSNGDELDVSYAVEIIYLLFDDEGELRYRHSGAIEAEDFDYWLSGFSSQQ